VGKYSHRNPHPKYSCRIARSQRNVRPAQRFRLAGKQSSSRSPDWAAFGLQRISFRWVVSHRMRLVYLLMVSGLGTPAPVRSLTARFNIEPSSPRTVGNLTISFICVPRCQNVPSIFASCVIVGTSRMRKI